MFIMICESYDYITPDVKLTLRWHKLLPDQKLSVTHVIIIFLHLLISGVVDSYEVGDFVVA